MSDILAKHERLILTVIAAAVILLGINWYLNHSTDVANKKVLLDEQALTDQTKKNDDLKTFVQQQTQQYQQLVTTLSAQNAQLLSTIASRNTATQKQQQIDNTLPLTDLGKRWQTLIKANDVDIVQKENGSLVVSDSASRTTVTQLELIPTLQENFTTEVDIATNKEKELASLTTVNDGLNKQVAGLNVQILDTKKQCQDELSLEKKKARSGKFKAFFYGMGVGAGLVAKLVL